MKPSIRGCTSWPARNGSSRCVTIVPTPFSDSPPAAPSSRPASSGVSTMPSRLESEALHSAAGTLPPAIEVNTTEACTADGSVHRNSTPR
jgi:hypothetical protein